ncbi:MAG: hypothetical protein GXO66_04050 [Euryarchaeota archaeon]|nr:hypothetical protein [Euryarchaeota archaeon]
MISRALVLLIFAAAAAVFLFTMLGEPRGEPPGGAPAPPPDYPAVEKEIFQRINGLRLDEGLPPLRWSDTLRDIARERAVHLAEMGYISHTSPEGEDVYDYLNRRGFFYTVAAENLYYIRTTNFSSLPAEAVGAWLRSPAHRSVIIDYDRLYTDAGVGVHCRENECYVVAVFAGREKSGELRLRSGYVAFVEIYDPAYPFRSPVEVEVSLSSTGEVNVYFVPSREEMERLAGGEAFSYYRAWRGVRSLEEELRVRRGEGLVIENRAAEGVEVEYRITYGEFVETAPAALTRESRQCPRRYSKNLTLRDGEFLYVQLSPTRRAIGVNLSAEKPVSVYVLNATREQVMKHYTAGMLPPGSLLEGCRREFVREVRMSCSPGAWLSDPGVLVHNRGIGDNTLSLSICG